MQLTWETGESWFDREYTLTDDGGTHVEKLGTEPTLDDLREAERRDGVRINLWQAGLLCSQCDEEINERFGADTAGNILCWDCAMAIESDSQAGVRVNTDPTKAIISESQLYQKSLCDYVINVATGCRHGCEFCYVPTTPAIDSREEMLNEQADVDDPQHDWGTYLLYRDDLPERLHNELETTDPADWGETDRGRGVTMLSSGTDCYQDRRTAQITRGCVQELVTHDRPVRILTRSPAMLRDLDVFQAAGNLLTVGSSIPSLDDELVKAMEPYAPPPSARWEALDELRRAGVRRYVSMSPTYPTMGEEELWNLLTYLKALQPEVIFHEPINPRGMNFHLCLEAARDAGRDQLAMELERLTENHQYWVSYALEQINAVQQLATEIGGLRIHSWPDHQLVEATSGQLQTSLRAMRKAVSPEQFPGEEPTSSTAQAELAEDIDAIRRMI